MGAPDVNCKLCGATGMVEVERETPHPPVFRRCDCALRKDILQNVERGLTGLSKVSAVTSSPLVSLENSNLWVTASPDHFLPHLRHLAIRKPVTWSFKVVSDAELVTAWLSTVALQGKDIIDADAYMVSTKYLSIPDLVVPPDLVIVRMGVKVARNSASSEVLAEALSIRTHEMKPTWIWDEHDRRLNSGHLFWSDEVGRILRPWGRLSLTTTDKDSQPPTSTSTNPQPTSSRKRKTLRSS